MNEMDCENHMIDIEREKRTRQYMIGIRLAILSGKSISPILMSFPDKNMKLLVIAPHFDDELIGCAGVLAEHIKHHHTCGVLYLTDGKGQNQQQYDSEVRKQEARLGLEHLGEIQSLYFDIPDGELYGNLHFSKNLVSRLTSDHYDRIYFPNPFDRYPDHNCAGRLLLEGLLATGQTPELYAYEIIEPFRFPNVYYEMSNYHTLKAKALGEHISQHQYINYTEISLEINKLRGLQVNGEECEMFQRFTVNDLQNIYSMQSIQTP